MGENSSVIAEVVPKATFVENVQAYVKESGKDVDLVLEDVRDMLQRYTHVEQELQQRKQRLQLKQPEIEKCLDAVNMLIERNDSGEDMDLDFSLSDHVYARATVQHAGYVGLWLGLGSW
eukprot:jgi/Picre1/28622/NNA_004022.t1